MSFQYNTCGKCFQGHEFYQHGTLVPPCPYCGYPEKKSPEEYYRSMGVEPKPYNEQPELVRRWDKAVDAGSPITARVGRNFLNK